MQPSTRRRLALVVLTLTVGALVTVRARRIAAVEAEFAAHHRPID